MQNRKKIPNALKWTEDVVLAHLAAIKKDALEGDDVTYLGKALIRQGLYVDIWKYWKKIFERNDAIVEEMMCIESIFEVRLFEGGLKKEFASWIAIFGLKNNHHWCEKQEEPEMEPGQGLIVQYDNETIVRIGAENAGIYKRVANVDVEGLEGLKLAEPKLALKSE